MPLPIKVWIVWMGACLVVTIATMIIHDAGRYEIHQWPFRLNGVALGGLAAGACMMVMAGLVLVMAA